MRAIGLMSGTSADGIDVAMIETDGEVIESFGPAATYPYSRPQYFLLRDAMEYAASVTDRADRGGILGVVERTITHRHIACVREFAETFGIDLDSIDVVGFHGQTVIHKPEERLSIQLGAGEALAKALRVPAVYDFRAADMAAGGQGAPLVPIYHHALAELARLPRPCVFLNIGGIANVTYVAEGGPENMIAFDTGPGNCLLDDWALRHTGVPLDKDAALALEGLVHQPTLEALLERPYFTQRPPKSLDRFSFTLDAMPEDISPVDGAATLTAFTVASIVAGATFFPEPPKVWVASGGGVRNPFLWAGLQRVLNTDLKTADEVGFDAQFMEAQAFAFLAARRLKGLPASYSGTTGVGEPQLAGTIAG